MAHEVVAACADNEVVGDDLLRKTQWEELQDLLVGATLRNAAGDLPDRLVILGVAQDPCQGAVCMRAKEQEAMRDSDTLD